LESRAVSAGYDTFSNEVRPIVRLNLRQAIAAIFLLSVSAATSGQALKNSQASPTKSPVSHVAPKNIYEDDLIKVRIPAEWTLATEKHEVSLSKGGYTLDLKYASEHASGIEGGRFIEILTIPWLDADDARTCSQFLSQRPQPVSRALILINLTLSTYETEVQTNCGIPKDLGYLVNEGNLKQIVGTQRWFAAYFTTASGGWFFPSDGAGCREKVYTLTAKATKPEELPDPEDPALKKTLAEAIDIVASIQYKRCPPSTSF
jgi:hypothetical protein